MNFRELLKHEKITQTQLALMVNKSQRLISSWVTGQCEPKLDMIKKLASIFNCSTDDILNCFNKKAAQ